MNQFSSTEDLDEMPLSMASQLCLVCLNTEQFLYNTPLYNTDSVVTQFSCQVLQRMNFHYFFTRKLYKGIIENYHEWSFSYNFLVKLSDKNIIHL